MPVFFVFFTVSGFCSLVYQIVWLRIAMANFGVTATMVAIVLSVFMAGLSAGSWGGGRIVLRRSGLPASSHLRLYALLEALIGLSGLAVAPLLTAGHNLLAGQDAVAMGSGSYHLVSGLVVGAALFPFCACIGATLPVAMAAVSGIFPEKARTSFSYLYLANLLGAVAGCVGSAFLLIELLGFRSTMHVAAVLNAAIAAAAFALAGQHTGRPLPDDSTVGAGDAQPLNLDDMLLAVVLLVTGFASMALEVIWVRQFTLFLGPLVYAFASILALFLLANYTGSAVYRRLREHPLLRCGYRPLALMLAIAGVATLAPLVTTDPRMPFGFTLGSGLLRVAIGVAPVGVAVGIITPWVVDRLTGGDPYRAGTAYGLNALGCILGPLGAGYLLLPLLGERWSLLLLSALFFLPVALLMLGSNQAAEPATLTAPALRVAVAALGGAALLLALAGSGYEQRYPGSVVLRDHTATVIAVGTGRNRQLLVNGYGMTELTPVTKFMVHFPLAMHAAQPARGLVLCFGMGTSFRSMVSWGIDTTVVELVPSIPRLFGYYHRDADQVMADPNAHVVIDDARRYLARTTERYDIIVVDPPPPIEAAASSLLYSVEFYDDVVRRLAPGGVFQQWTDINDPYLLAAITRSLVRGFPHVKAYRPVTGSGIHFIASQTPLPEKGPAGLAAALPQRAAADLVEWGPHPTPAEQFRAVLEQEQSIEALLRAGGPAPAIVDDRPVNEYFLLRQHLGWRPGG